MTVEKILAELVANVPWGCIEKVELISGITADGPMIGLRIWSGVYLAQYERYQYLDVEEAYRRLVRNTIRLVRYHNGGIDTKNI